MIRDLVDFENTYIQTAEDFSEDVRGNAAKACITIDGYTANEDEEGEVVCRVWMTSDNNFIIDWHNNGYRMNQTVLDLIEDSIKILSEQYPKEETPAQ